MQIKAVVSIRGVVDTWGAVTNLLKQRGRPKVMVVIKETVNGTTREESHLRAQIENRLKQAGFRLVNQSQISAINQKKLQTAIAEDKPDVVAAMAKQFGAQIFVMGTAQSTGRAVNVGGIAAWRYAAVGVVRTFRSDTGELLSSRTQRRSDLERSALAAAQKALENLGTVTAPLIVRDVLRFWQDAIEGRGEIQLEVTKLEKFSNYVKVKKAVAAIDGVKAINGNYHNGVAKFTIDSDVIAEKLAERIVETLEEKLEVEDVSANTITATFKKP